MKLIRSVSAIVAALALGLGSTAALAGVLNISFGAEDNAQREAFKTLVSDFRAANPDVDVHLTIQDVPDLPQDAARLAGHRRRARRLQLVRRRPDAHDGAARRARRPQRPVEGQHLVEHVPQRGRHGRRQAVRAALPVLPVGPVHAPRRARARRHPRAAARPERDHDGVLQAAQGGLHADRAQRQGRLGAGRVVRLHRHARQRLRIPPAAARRQGLVQREQRAPHVRDVEAADRRQVLRPERAGRRRARRQGRPVRRPRRHAADGHRRQRELPRHRASGDRLRALPGHRQRPGRRPRPRRPTPSRSPRTRRTRPTRAAS